MSFGYLLLCAVLMYELNMVLAKKTGTVHKTVKNCNYTGSILTKSENSLAALLRNFVKTDTMKPLAKKNRKSEELWNALTHGTGAVLSVVALVAMLVFSILNGTAVHIAASLVFGISLILLYTASTVYHSVWTLKWKRILKQADHLCIYLLIAGTYTPVALIGLKGAWGWAIFGLIWALAIVGFIFKFTSLRYNDKLSLTLYALMGWLIIVAIKPMISSLSTGMLLYILGGGLCYTFGIYFYAKERIPYNHAIWHMFVLGGSALHFTGIFLYLIP